MREFNKSARTDSERNSMMLELKSIKSKVKMPCVVLAQNQIKEKWHQDNKLLEEKYDIKL